MKIKKILLVLLVGLLAGALVLTGCESDSIPKDVKVTFTNLTADGSATATTTQLTLTFDNAIAGLTADDIVLSGVPGVGKWTLSGSNPYTLPISGFTSGGTLNVAVSKSGYTINGSPKTATVYYYSGSGNPSGGEGKTEFLFASQSVQEALNEAKTHQESAYLAEFISAAYNPDLKYIFLTYKVGTIKNMFLQYLSNVIVAAPGREYTYSQTIGYSDTEKFENNNTIAMNFNLTVCYGGAGAFAGAFAGADVFAGLASLIGLKPGANANAEAYAKAYATAVASVGRVDFDLKSVITNTYTRTYQRTFVVKNEIKQDMSIYPAGKKYAVAAFADVGIYQILKYDPQTKTATAIPGESLWFNVESEPRWDMYEYSDREELSIPQQLKPFEKMNVEVKEDDLYSGLEKTQTITFYEGNLRVDDIYRFDWKPITLILPLLREFGYKTVSFKWETYWAKNEAKLVCTARVVMDCADINLYRGDWTYYDNVVNPDAEWKWTPLNFSSPIGTVTDRPNIRCVYGYSKRDDGIFGIGKAYYYIGKVKVTVTALK